MTTDLAPVEHGIQSFWSPDPTMMVEQVSAQASALKDVIDKQGLSTNIGRSVHVNIEGWQTVGAMVGVFAVIEWTRELTDDEGKNLGWEARSVATTMEGNVVGAAEAECRRSESTWQNRDSYALRSMAQTRAMSKSLRGPLGFIVALAGYSATPQEEMTPLLTPAANAKTYALTMAGGDKAKAKADYSAALEVTEIKAVRTTEDADAVIAALGELSDEALDESPFEEAEVVDDEAEVDSG